MRVLISGAGIAGPTFAYWLAHYGIEATIVEKAPRLRTGGYVIDFWGLGFDVADRMGLLAEIRRKGYIVRDVSIVNRAGKRIAGFPADAVARVAQGRYVSVARGDLAATIFGAIDGKIESIFNDSVARIDQTAQSAQVTFESGTARDFDLVVGADGLHSRVRGLVFGPEDQFEKYLGYKVAAFEVHGYRPRDELVYVMYTEVAQQVARFAMSGDRTMFLFVFADHERDDAAPGDLQAQKALLRKRYGASGWECPQILDALEAASELYLTASARSTWALRRDRGPTAASLCSAMLLSAYRCSPAKVRRWPWCRPTFLRANFTLRAAIMRRRFAIPAAIRCLRAPEAERRVALCGHICAEVQVLDVRAQPGDESAQNTDRRGSCRRPRPR